jgi:hypothetical protein
LKPTPTTPTTPTPVPLVGMGDEDWVVVVGVVMVGGVVAVAVGVVVDPPVVAPCWPVGKGLSRKRDHALSKGLG